VSSNIVLIDPAEEPLSVDQAKKHLKQEDAEDDDLIGDMLTGVRQFLEDQLNTQLVTATRLETLDTFPGHAECQSELKYAGGGRGVITLRFPPVQTINAIRYVDTNGVQQTLSPSEYVADLRSRPARIEPAYGKAWPATRRQLNAVEVEFVCGFGPEPSVPRIYKQMIRSILGHWYVTREEATENELIPIPFGAGVLIRQLRY